MNTKESNAINTLAEHTHELCLLIDLDGKVLAKQHIANKFEKATDEIAIEARHMRDRTDELAKRMQTGDYAPNEPESVWKHAEKFAQHVMDYEKLLNATRRSYDGPAKAHLAGYRGAWQSMAQSLRNDVEQHAKEV